MIYPYSAQNVGERIQGYLTTCVSASQQFICTCYGPSFETQGEKKNGIYPPPAAFVEQAQVTQPLNDWISGNVGQSTLWHTGGTDIGQWESRGVDESCIYGKQG